MQQSIEIISQYPDLGQCIHHWEEITHVCCEKQCTNLREGFYCQKCEPFHFEHKTKSSSQFVHDLAKKIVSNQPSEKANKQSLQKTFKSIKQLSKQFQQSIRSISQILSQINTRKILIYEEALKCSQKQMYDKLCEWDLSQNSSALINASSTLPKLKFGHAGAPAFYQNQLKQIRSMVGRFSEKVQNLMEEALKISDSFNFEKNINQIEKYAPSKIKDQPKIKASSVVQNSSTIINLSGKDMFGSEIIQKLNQGYSINLKELNLNGNTLDSESMSQIFTSQRLAFPNLEKLTLSNCYLDDDCISILLSSNNIPALKYLKISENQFEYFTSHIIDNIKAKWPGIHLIA